ncbi:hypothetical protein M441DRAFT_98329, partial [Trichoderma asperellum CBS 433.97]
MGLGAVPPELILNIARFLHLRRDVNALARVNQYLYAILDPVLYHGSAKRLSGYVLQWATRNDSVQTVKKALQYGAYPNAVEIGENCALRFAVEHGHLAIVKLLLDHGAIIRDPMILGTAALHGFDEITKLLLDHGASPNAVACQGKTPLLLAAQKGSETTFALLLQRGA